MNSIVRLNYTSTLDGSVLILTCKNEMSNINSTDKLILNVTCNSNGNWIPNPTGFIKSCSSFTTIIPPGIVNYESIIIEEFSYSKSVANIKNPNIIIGDLDVIQKGTCMKSIKLLHELCLQHKVRIVIYSIETILFSNQCHMG